MSQVVSQLRQDLAALSGKPSSAWEEISSGFAELDAVLPGGGFRRGNLVEWLALEFGSGATSLALRSARRAMGDDRTLVVVERQGTFFPPALEENFPWERLLLVRCDHVREAAWACDQALRTSGVGAVLTWLDHVDERLLRRWQLAAAGSGALGLVVRHLPRQPEACFCDVRILVAPLDAAGGRRVYLELLRLRQGRAGARVEVALDGDSHSLSQTDRPARRATGS